LGEVDETAPHEFHGLRKKWRALTNPPDPKEPEKHSELEFERN
jgi:hypothetical protein